MASIWKDPRSSNWIACYTDVHGKQTKKTTGSANRKEAQKIANAYELVATRRQTQRTVRDTIASISRELWGIDAPMVTLREHVQSWVNEKKADTADSTRNFYEQSTTKFLDFLGSVADQSIEEITRSHVAGFKTELAKSVLPKTVNHHLKCVRAIFKAARRDGLIVDDPAEFVETMKKVGKSNRRPFTMDELRSVLAACDDEWRSMVLCGLYTGQRLIDVACLRWQNVDLVKGEIRLAVRKTGKHLKIPIAPPLQKHLESLPSSDDPATPLHPCAFAVIEKTQRSGGLSNQFSAILVAAGLRDVECLNKTSTGKGRSAKRVQNELSFHCLRHTAVTLLKEAGIPAAVVMELIGHDTEQMSQHYTHVGKEAMEKAAASMPDLMG